MLDCTLLDLLGSNRNSIEKACLNDILDKVHASIARLISARLMSQAFASRRGVFEKGLMR